METQDKKNNKIILVGVLLIALVFVFTFFRSKNNEKDLENLATKETRSYPQISSEELIKKTFKEKDFQILDIRSQENYQFEHLVDSINIPEGKISENISPDKKTIILGDNFENSSIFFDFLKKNNFSEVLILSGGIESWKKAGGNTISIGNPNSFVDQSKVTYITPEELKKRVEEKKYPFYIIDVRSKQSFNNGHLPEAENIALDDIEKNREIIPFGKEIFVYGETEFQGFQAGVRLYDLNFYAAKVLKGGIASWNEKGFELVK